MRKNKSCVRYGLQWSGRRTDEPSSPRERAPPLVLFRAVLSLYLSRSFMTIWDRDGGKLERFDSLGGWRLHMSDRESNEKKVKYGKLGYAVPLVFSGMAGTSSSSSGSGYECSTKSSQCSFTRVLSVLDMVFCYLIVRLKSECYKLTLPRPPRGSGRFLTPKLGYLQSSRLPYLQI